MTLRTNTSKNIKIFYACNSDLGKHGNIGFRTFYVAKEAYKRGNLDKIICRDNCQDSIPSKFIEKVSFYFRPLNLALSAIQLFISGKFPGRKLNLKLFDKLIKNRIPKVDIFHCYDYSIESLKKSKELGNINVMDTQMAHPGSSNVVNSKGDYKERSFEHNKVVEYADYIVCSSEFVVETYLKNTNVKKDQLLYLPHGVDVNKFVPSKEKNKKFTCLFVGIINQRKGVSYLLKAWEDLKFENAELIICGRVYIDMKEILEDYIKRNDSIIYKGFVDPINEFKKADVFVFPSLFESSGKVLYEAMASGLPIITTFNAGPPFKDKECGYIVPVKDSVAIANKIKLLKNNKNLRSKFGNNGRKLAENLTWDDYGEKMNNYYQKIIKKLK